MKTDTLFYKLLETQPSLLLRLAHLESLRNVPYRFQSIELKEKAQRTDAILLPEQGAPPDAPVIVCEVQFWMDEFIYTRLVSETALLHLQMPDIRNLQMVLILRSRGIDTNPGTWQALVTDGTIQVVYMDEIHTAEEESVQPEEQAALLLMQMTVTPHNRLADDELIPKLGATIARTKNQALQTMFRDLFVSLYISKYKNLSIQEVRAMITTAEIFDDIHESLAVQQYGQELAQKARLEGKIEGVPNLLRLGLSASQVAEALNIPLERVLEIQSSI